MAAGLLQTIVESKQQEVAHAKRRIPVARLRERIQRVESPRGFAQRLKQATPMGLIAELKRKSPRLGVLREPFEPVKLALECEAAGAAALSILTDGPFFGGSLDDLWAVRRETRLPILRKDFLIDDYQIYESRWRGADAILLIVAILARDQLAQLLAVAQRHQMDALVEVHTEAELKRALAAGATLIGVNHRDLRTFTVDFDVSRRLGALIPSGLLWVAESGIEHAAEVRALQQRGCHGILVGETLMKSPDLTGTIRKLMGRVPSC